MRPHPFGVIITVLALAAGCTSGATSTLPSHTTTPAPASTAAAGVLPNELVGAWSAPSNTTEVAVRFLADGRYRSIEILSQPRPEGVFEFRRQEDGTARTSGDRLELRPKTATLSRTDPGDPTGDYTNRPTAASPHTYTWRVNGTTLVLTDAQGHPLAFQRQP
jgi:hypothetical protein